MNANPNGPYRFQIFGAAGNRHSGGKATWTLPASVDAREVTWDDSVELDAFTCVAR